jgi:hypothetical protein
LRAVVRVDQGDVSIAGQGKVVNCSRDSSALRKRLRALERDVPDASLLVGKAYGDDSPE